MRLGPDLGQVATHVTPESLLTIQVRFYPEPDPQAPGISPGSHLITVSAWLSEWPRLPEETEDGPH